LPHPVVVVDCHCTHSVAAVDGRRLSFYARRRTTYLEHSSTTVRNSSR